MVDPAELGDMPASPVRQQYLQLDKLDDDRLLSIHAEAMAVGNISALRKLVPEILSREHLDEKIPRDVSLSMMAQMTEGDDEALEYLQQAKNIAKENGRPIGVYLVQELELRMLRGLTDKLAGLLQRIQIHHLGEPNVEYQLARVLNRFGLLDQEAQVPGVDPGALEEPKGEAAGGLWTPDQVAPGPDEAVKEQATDSKLWLPGSD